MSLMDAALAKESALPQETGRMAKTISYYAAFVALGLSSASLGPTLPGLAANTHTHLSQISFLFTGRALGYLLGSLLGGRLYDRKPGHPVMALVLMGMAVALFLTPLMAQLWLLTAVLLVLGIVEANLDVGANTLLVWVHRDKVGPYMNGLHFFFGIGAFLSPIIIAQMLLMSGGITWAYWLLALLMLPTALWLLRLPSPPIQKTVKDSGASQVNYRLVALFVLFFFLYVGAESGFGGWIYTYAVSVNLAGVTTAAYLTSAYWGSFTAGRLLSIPIAFRVRPRYILLGDLLGSLVSLVAILVWSNSLIALWLGTLGLGLSTASVFPTLISLAERRMTITGQITGWFFMGASGGAMFLPWLIGQLFDQVGPHVMLTIFIVDTLLTLVICFILISYSAGQPEMKTEEALSGVSE